MNQSLLESLRKDLLRMLEVLGVLAAKQAPTPPISPVVPPITPPAPFLNGYLWNNAANSRHSIRVICDEMGLTVEQKNLITAVIQAESGFNNAAKLVNKNKDGTVHSTDWGICQINSFYHIGPGKKWSSVQQVIDNPDKCVKWMITLYRQGHLDWWVAYKNGSYKKYLV